MGFRHRADLAVFEYEMTGENAGGQCYKKASVLPGGAKLNLSFPASLPASRYYRRIRYEFGNELLTVEVQ